MQSLSCVLPGLSRHRGHARLCRWFDNTLMTRFRGALHYDGGLTNFIPLPPGIDVGIRVCCLPAGQLNTVYPIDITPDSFEAWPYTASEVRQCPFSPFSQSRLWRDHAGIEMKLLSCPSQIPGALHFAKLKTACPEALH